MKNKNERNLFKVKQVLVKPGINTHSQEIFIQCVVVSPVLKTTFSNKRKKKQTTHEQKTLEITNNLHFGQ